MTQHHCLQNNTVTNVSLLSCTLYSPHVLYDLWVERLFWRLIQAAEENSHTAKVCSRPE